MNKKILNTIFFISIAIAASYNYNQIHKDIKLSDLALANIEALARNEDDESWGGGCGITCGYQEGQCWTPDLSSFYNCGEYTMVHGCVFSGYQSDSCYNPC